MFKGRALRSLKGTPIGYIGENLSKRENEVFGLEVGEALVQGGEEADLRHVLNAQLLQQGVFPQDNLRQRRGRACVLQRVKAWFIVRTVI